MALEKEQTTEKAILEAATKLFVEKGFSATSTTAIAKEVGCNQAAVHYYYRTKDRLFESILENKFKYFVTKFLEISNENIPFEEKLTKKIETHFDLIRENSKIPLFLISELGTNPNRLEGLKKTFSDFPQAAILEFQKELDAEVKRGSIRRTNVLDILLTIVSLNVALYLIGPIFKIINNITDTEFEKLITKRKKEHVRIILESLKP